MSIVTYNFKKQEFKEGAFLEEEIATSLCPSAICFQMAVQLTEVLVFLETPTVYNLP